VARVPDHAAVAGEVVACLDEHRQTTLFSGRSDGFTLADAHRVTPHIRAAFEARGETIVGRKIGFTNHDMWKAFGVSAPIWGYATDRTLHELKDTPSLPARAFIGPRIEPEIMFGLKSAPRPGMDDETLLDCIDWLSLGYEVVPSIYPGWKFTAADAVAANSVHGAFLVGSRHAVAPRKRQWREELANFSVELYCNGKLSQRGGGAVVLGSPLNALRHLVELLAHDPNNPPLGAGEIISTGTLTLAMPVGAGESWTTKVSGIPLDEITLRFG